jgi:hypothetical protein
LASELCEHEQIVEAERTALQLRTAAAKVPADLPRNLNSADIPLTLSLSPSEGDRVPSGRVRRFRASVRARPAQRIAAPHASEKLSAPRGVGIESCM